MTKRDAIIGLRATISKIIKQLKVPKSTFCAVVMMYKELGNTKDCPESGHSCSCRTKNNIKAVRERLRRDSKRSMRKIALDLKMDPKSMRTTVETDLTCYYRSTMKDSWESSSSLEFAEIWHAEGWNRFFFRRKVFTLEAKFNPQNDRVALHTEDVPE